MCAYDYGAGYIWGIQSTTSGGNICTSGSSTSYGYVKENAVLNVINDNTITPSIYCYIDGDPVYTTTSSVTNCYSGYDNSYGQEYCYSMHPSVGLDYETLSSIDKYIYE